MQINARSRRSATILTASLALLCAGHAAAGSFALVPEAGLAGYGGLVEWAADNRWSFSAGYTGGDFKARIKTDDTDYDAKIRLRNPQLFVNWSPFDGYFRLSAGVITQDSSVTLSARRNANGLIVVNGTPLVGIDSLTGTATVPNSVAPALTLGWQTPQDRPGFGYSLSAGVMYTGSPKVTAAVTGPTAAAATGSGAVEMERRRIENELDKYKFLPILQAGLVYRL